MHCPDYAGLGVFSAFFSEMRRFLAIVAVFQCARMVIAGTLPLTGDDIVLMLRMGYSSDEIVRDLKTKRFAGSLDSTSEAQIQQLNASPKLLDALKSGQFDATPDQLAQAQQRIAAVNSEAEELTREQIAFQNRAIEQRSTAFNRSVERQSHPASPKIIELPIGQTLDLRKFGGPNVRVGVTAVEMDEMVVTLLDYGHMRTVGWRHGTGYLAGLSPEPTVIRKRVPKAANSLIYRWGRSKLVYPDVMDVAQNHVKLAIVSE